MAVPEGTQYAACLLYTSQVFTQLVIVLAEKGFITLDVEYIDGTKIESKTNKYTFVWRKSTEKHRAKLIEKIKVLLEQIDESIAQENAGQENGQSFTPTELMNIACLLYTSRCV